MFQEFKKFAMKGNMFDMAVGIISSLVADVLMPAVGLLVGNVDFSNLFLVLKKGRTLGPYTTVAAAKEAGAVTLNYGVFTNTIVNFLIIAIALFFVIRGINNLKRKEEAPPAVPTTKECPLCLSTIPIKATRCGHCTSDLKAA